MSKEELANVIASWYWVPHGSIVLENERYRLSLWKNSPERNIVDRFNADDAGRLIDEVEALVRKEGRRTLTWQCKPGSGPRDMGEWLQRRDYSLSDRLEYLCFDMGEGRTPRLPGLRTAADAEVGKVRTIEDAVQSLRVSEGAFNEAPFTGDEILGRAEELLRESGDEANMTIFGKVGGRTVCSGGATVEGNILKLWGAGTHPDYRKRGLYGSLVIARCTEGYRLGTRYAVVTARETTSTPILVRAGFQRLGLELHYRKNLPVR